MALAFGDFSFFRFAFSMTFINLSCPRFFLPFCCGSCWFIYLYFFFSFFDVILCLLFVWIVRVPVIFVWIFRRKVSIKHQFIIHHFIDITRKSISCFQSYPLASLAPMVGSIKSWTKPITFFSLFFFFSFVYQQKVCDNFFSSSIASMEQISWDIITFSLNWLRFDADRETHWKPFFETISHRNRSHTYTHIYAASKCSETKYQFSFIQLCFSLSLFLCDLFLS